MKILVLSPPMGATGGIQNYTASLVRALADIFGEKNVRLVAVPAEASPRADGSVALSPLTKLRFFSRAIGSAVWWRPQLIICTHVGVAPVGRIIQRITRAPYWVMLHGIEVWGKLSRAKIASLFAAQQLIGVSRFTVQAAAARHGFNAAKAAVLSPTFSINELRGPSTIGAVGDATRPKVLTVARLAASERYKGHDVMLDAWPAVIREVPGAQYIIVGDGDDRARLETRVKEMGLGDSVLFKGALSGAELQSCYDECGVFALPARTELDSQPPRGEGFGIVFLEAMAHGKPVVGPNVGAPAEFIRNGEHGLLVDPVNAEQLSAALIEILRQPERAQQMGRAGREWVNQQFSYEMFRERLRGILRAHSYEK
jgi:glycosyltransferase involved in cell wall biosynthesis